MSDVFVSYSRADRSRVEPLIQELQNHGFSVWWDTQMLPGELWDEAILGALAEARSVVVVWSNESVNSANVKEEAHRAQQRGILVPVQIDEISPPLRIWT